MQRVIGLAQEPDGFEVLPSAVGIWQPLAGSSRVVQVEHRCHGVHPDPVGVELFRPVTCIRHEEVAHLIASVVEDVGAPVRVLASTRIGMLVQRRAVEARQRPIITWKVRGHPVEDHADAVLVQMIDEEAEIVGAAVASSRCVIAGDLVSPGAAKRMLHHRHQLDVRETHLVAVLREPLRDVPVPEHSTAFAVTPRPQVHLVDRHGRRDRRPLGTLFHPQGVAPRVRGLGDDAGGGGRTLGCSRERIRLEHLLPVDARHPELVFRARPHAGDEELPHTRRSEYAHGPGACVPVVRVADEMHAVRVRRPHGERGAGGPLMLDDACAESPPQCLVRAFADQMQVKFPESR